MSLKHKLGKLGLASLAIFLAAGISMVSYEYGKSSERIFNKGRTLNALGRLTLEADSLQRYLKKSDLDSFTRYRINLKLKGVKYATNRLEEELNKQ